MRNYIDELIASEEDNATLKTENTKLKNRVMDLEADVAKLRGDKTPMRDWFDKQAKKQQEIRKRHSLDYTA